MKTKQDISDYISSILKDWLPVKAKPIHISFMKSEGVMAKVGCLVIKDGISYIKDENTIQLSINEKLMKKDIDQIKRTLAHEAYHIIQRHYFSSKEMRERSAVSVAENRVSSYTPNLNELEAEVFAINHCGCSNHSYKCAKDEPLYRETLNSILRRSEYFEFI